MKNSTKFILIGGAVLVGLYAVSKFFKTTGKGLSDITQGAGTVSTEIGGATADTRKFYNWELDKLKSYQTGLENFFTKLYNTISTAGKTAFDELSRTKESETSVNLPTIPNKIDIPIGTYDFSQGIYLDNQGRGFSVAPEYLNQFAIKKEKITPWVTALTTPLVNPVSVHVSSNSMSKTNYALNAYVKGIKSFVGGGGSVLDAISYTKKAFAKT